MVKALFALLVLGVFGMPAQAQYVSRSTTGTLAAQPSTCPAAGDTYIATDQIGHQQFYGCTGARKPILINILTATYNARDWGVLCNGLTDDTANMSAFVTFMNSQTQAVGYIPAGKCLINGPLRFTSSNWLRGDGYQSTYLIQTNPNSDLLIVTGSTQTNPTGYSGGPIISDLALAGQGTLTTGNLLILNTNGRVVLQNVGFYGHGGRAILDETQRCFMTNLHFSDTRLAIGTNPNVAINESYLKNFTVMHPGFAQDDLATSGNTSTYCYNANSVGGVYPTSGTIFQDPHAAIDLGGNVANWEIQDGSIKPTGCIGGIRIRASMDTSVSHVSVSGTSNGNITPSIIYGGNHEKTTTSTAMSASSTNVDVANGQWFPYVGSSSDLLSATTASYVIRPPDYVPGSTTASSIGGGILQGNFEYVTFQGILHDSSTTGWHLYMTARGTNSTSAYAWPAGAIVEEGWGSPLDAGTISNPQPLHLSDNHLVSFYPTTGFTFTSNPAIERTAGEVVAGLEPDTFYVEGSSNIASGFVNGLRFDGSNLFFYASAPQGNIDTYTNVLVDMGGATGTFVDAGGTFASSTTLIAGAAGANQITREVFGGATGTTLVYKDRASGLGSSGAATTALTGCATSLLTGIKSCTDISTPSVNGVTQVYTKGGTECALSSTGTETCTGSGGGGGGGSLAITGGNGVGIDQTATSTVVPLDISQVVNTSQNTTFLRSQGGQWNVYSGNTVSAVGIAGGGAAFTNTTGGSDWETDICNANTSQAITFTMSGTNTVNGAAASNFVLSTGTHIHLVINTAPSNPDFQISGVDACTGVGPFTVSTGGGGGSGPTLQTNGTNNASQTTLNLVQGVNSFLTNSGGNVTFNNGAVSSVSFTATPAFPLGSGDQLITLTGNVTSSTVSGVRAGIVVRFQICQDGTGGRTFTWPAVFHGTGTIGTMAGTCSVQTFESFDGSNLYATGPMMINQ